MRKNFWGGLTIPAFFLIFGLGLIGCPTGNNNNNNGNNNDGDSEDGDTQPKVTYTNVTNYVTAPSAGKVPVAEVKLSNNAQAQYSATLIWYEADGSTEFTGTKTGTEKPDVAEFDGEKVYVAKLDLTAKDDLIFTADSWSHDGANSVTCAISEDGKQNTVTIQFKATGKMPVWVTMQNGIIDIASKPVKNRYAPGTVVKITANAAAGGNSGFKKWEYDFGSGSSDTLDIDEPQTRSTSFEMPSSPVTVTASFDTAVSLNSTTTQYGEADGGYAAGAKVKFTWKQPTGGGSGWTAKQGFLIWDLSDDTSGVDLDTKTLETTYFTMPSTSPTIKAKSLCAYARRYFRCSGFWEVDGVAIDQVLLWNANARSTFLVDDDGLLAFGTGDYAEYGNEWIMLLDTQDNYADIRPYLDITMNHRPNVLRNKWVFRNVKTGNCITSKGLTIQNFSDAANGEQLQCLPYEDDEGFYWYISAGMGVNNDEHPLGFGNLYQLFDFSVFNGPITDDDGDAYTYSVSFPVGEGVRSDTDEGRATKMGFWDVMGNHTTLSLSPSGNNGSLYAVKYLGTPDATADTSLFNYQPSKPAYTNKNNVTYTGNYNHEKFCKNGGRHTLWNMNWPVDPAVINAGENSFRTYRDNAKPYGTYTTPQKDKWWNAEY